MAVYSDVAPHPDTTHEREKGTDSNCIECKLLWE